MKCNTPIDQETKMALAGSALEAALKDPNSPRCGQELSADDIFCPACGAKVENKSSAQGTFVPCGSDSAAPGKGAGSLFCSHCRGRAPRSELWSVWLKAVLAYAVVVAILIAGNAGSSQIDYLGKAMLAIAGFMICICTLPVAVRRLHDRGNSGKAMIPSVCFSFVSTALVLSGNDASLTGDNASFVCAIVGIMAAAYNLFLFVAIGLIRGTKGPNKYGPDPLETK